MKIGFSTSVIQRGKTGVAQYIFALLRAFDACDVDHRFSLFVLEEDRPLFEGLGERFQIIPVAEQHRPAVRNILWHQRELPAIARRLQLDLLHVPSYRRLLWTSHCPRVGTIHDLAPFKVSAKYDLARMFYGRVVVKQLARRQSAIIAVSHNTAKDIAQYFGIPKERVRVIHNGLDQDRFHPRNRENARAFAQAKWDLSKPFFLYVARLEHPGKNHVRLIEAFDEFKRKTGSPWQLVFGGSDWHGAETIHGRSRQSEFATDIRSLGFVSDADLPMLYSAADAFVYPSLYEGFGMPPLEAMACGCPVICSDRGSLGEIVGDAARIINPDDMGSITEALSQVASGHDCRADLIRKGLVRAAEFSWRRAASETLEVYRSAAGGSGVSRTVGGSVEAIDAPALVRD